MKRLTLLVGLLAAASVASAASADRTVTSPGKVDALARSGFNVAFLSAPYKGHCGAHVELWDLVSGGVRKLGRHTDLFCRDSGGTGSGVTDIAVASHRVVWLAYTG